MSYVTTLGYLKWFEAGGDLELNAVLLWSWGKIWSWYDMECYPPLGDTKPVNHSTETSQFTCSVGKKLHCEAKNNTPVMF